MDQDVCLFSRKRMEMTGIDEVESCTDTEVVLASQAGRIAVTGTGLKIGVFSAESGKLCLTGTVDTLQYIDGEREEGGRRGFFGKLFR